MRVLSGGKDSKIERESYVNYRNYIYLHFVTVLSNSENKANLLLTPNFLIVTCCRSSIANNLDCDIF